MSNELILIIGIIAISLFILGLIWYKTKATTGEGHTMALVGGMRGRETIRQ